MNDYLINLKPTPIYKVENFYTCNEKEIKCLKSFNYVKNQIHKNYITDGNIFENKDLKNLKKAITDKFHYFTSNIIGINNKFNMERNWATINYKGQNHGPHTHPNIVFALSFYVKCKNGAINFKTDNNRTSISESFNFNYEKNKDNIYNSDMWKMPVKTGDLIIFPGHVTHYGDPHLDDDERIMIGVNWFPRGRLFTSVNKNEWIDL